MKKITVIEDDVDSAHFYKILLEREGFETNVFSNGHEALPLEESLPDLFILDVEIPGINGLDLCKQLKIQSATKNIPIILISATPSLKKLADEVYANESLEKPFNPRTLLSLINKCLHPKPSN